MLRNEEFLLIIHLKTMPEGSLEIENIFLSMILMEMPFYLLSCSIWTPWID